ncbi:MAG: hypothetical protein Q4E12_05155 [Coriobacteriia bacterium]|nr:hypothetical protein [Coriobacteriia bacterium]
MSIFITHDSWGSAAAFNAGNKARDDVFRFLEDRATALDIPVEKPQRVGKGGLAKIADHVRIARAWKRALQVAGEGDLVIIQFPVVCHTLFLAQALRSVQRRGVRIALLVHDSDVVRQAAGEGAASAGALRLRMEEESALKQADYVIAHNEAMAALLADRFAVPQDRLVTLGLFDYWVGEDAGREHATRNPVPFCPQSDHASSSPQQKSTGIRVVCPRPVRPAVVVAGNLSPQKAGYVYHLPEDVPFALYGAGYKPDDTFTNVTYCGTFAPDQGPATLQGSFGLVWDGPSAETCVGGYGEYLRVNNPHKTSLYLAAGLPVVIWDQAALAPFITENNLGITVSSLSELSAVLAAVTPEAYAAMAANAQRMGVQLTAGTHLHHAVDAVLERMGGGEHATRTPEPFCRQGDAASPPYPQKSTGVRVVSPRGFAAQRMSNVCFAVAFGLWLAFSLLNASFYASIIPESLSTLVRYFAMALLVVSELTAGEVIFRRSAAKHLACLAGAVILYATLAVAVPSDTATLLDTIAFVYCARNRDFRFLAKLALAITAACVVVIVLSACVGIIPNYLDTTQGRHRFYLGFRYALWVGQLLFVITCLWLYLRGTTLRIGEAVALILLNAAVFYFADTRLSFALATALTLLCFLVAKLGARPSGQPQSPRALCVLAFSFVFAAVLSVAFTAFYSPDNPVLQALNQGILGTRLSLGHSALTQYGISLFGQDIQLVGFGLNLLGERNTSAAYNYIDCMYVRMLVQLGLLYTAVYLGLFTVAGWRAAKQGNIVLLLIFAAIALNGIINDLSLYLFYNPFLLLAATILRDSVVDCEEENAQANYADRKGEPWVPKSILQ